MIETERLTRIYQSGGSEVRAVEYAELTVRQGEFIMILGRSGSGKSTLLGMLAGLIRPTSGAVRFKGREIGNLPDDAISALRAREIGFIFQFSGLIPTVSVRENVMLPALFCPRRPDTERRALDLLARVGLSDRAGAYPATLSSGEMKRVAIARALINDPSLLIADEPTGDLDVDTEFEIMELFRGLNQEGMTIVMVTHNPDLARYATRVYGMDRGRLTEGLRPGHPGHGQRGG